MSRWSREEAIACNSRRVEVERPLLSSSDGRKLVAALEKCAFSHRMVDFVTADCAEVGLGSGEMLQCTQA